MKKPYEKPEIVSEKMELDLLHTACSLPNNKSRNILSKCAPPCTDLGTKFTGNP